MSPELTRARGLLSHLVSKRDATMDDYREAGSAVELIGNLLAKRFADS